MCIIFHIHYIAAATFAPYKLGLTFFRDIIVYLEQCSF